VAGDGGIVSEYGIFHHRFSRPHSLKEVLQVRPNIVPIMAAIKHLAFEWFLPQRWVMLSVPLLKICLLYTSDAADDMQCVDLGGRRIIKKK